MRGFHAKSISNRPSCDCNGFSSLTTASSQSILVAAAARPPAIPFLLLPASRTATHAVLPVEQNVERRTRAHLACARHRHVRTDSGPWGSYTHRGPAGIRRTQRSDDLPDCLNHERLGAWNFALGLLASGKWSRHDADTFKMDFSSWSLGRRVCRCEFISRATDDPRRLDHSGRGIEVLDDAPAGRISRSRQDLQYRMDPIPGHRTDDAGAGGRCARLRNAGAFVAGEWRGRWQ